MHEENDIKANEITNEVKEVPEEEKKANEDII